MVSRDRAPDSPPSRLSPRERQVLALLSKGWDNARIGQTCSSASTPSAPTSRTSSRSSACTKLEAATFAMQRSMELELTTGGAGMDHDPTNHDGPQGARLVTIGEQRVSGPRGGLPHGGQLVDRRLDAEEASALASSPLPSLPLTAAEAADLRALATGAYSPLTGFMGAKEHESVTESMRLPDGTLVDPGVPGPDGVRVDDGRLALRGEGELLGVLEVTEVFDATGPPRPSWCLRHQRPRAPGVARVLGAPSRAVAGPVQAVVAPWPGRWASGP